LSILQGIVYNASKGHFSESKAELLLSLANSSIGFYTVSDKLIIKQIVQSILLHQEQNLACCLYGEICNISNFHNADALVAFSGINPLVYESGKFKAKNTMISKKGSALFKKCTYSSF